MERERSQSVALKRREEKRRLGGAEQHRVSVDAQRLGGAKCVSGCGCLAWRTDVAAVLRGSRMGATAGEVIGSGLVGVGGRGSVSQCVTCVERGTCVRRVRVQGKLCARFCAVWFALPSAFRAVSGRESEHH